MENKKGDMTIGTIITIVVLLMGFAVVLFFVYQIFFNTRVDREACHQSIVFRATLPAFGGIQQAVNLKCKTEKICLTSGGLFGGTGSCDEFKGFKGITNVKVKTVEQIERTIAQSIVDCWSMTGEGKVDLFSQYYVQAFGFGTVYPSCIICSRIAFDEEGLAKVGITKEKLATMDVEKYMRNHAVPNKQVSYYEYMVGNSPAKPDVKANLLGLQGETAQSAGTGLSISPNPAVCLLNQPCDRSLKISGGIAPYKVSSLASPNNQVSFSCTPEGACLISGTPTEAAKYEFEIADSASAPGSLNFNIDARMLNSDENVQSAIGSVDGSDIQSLANDPTDQAPLQMKELAILFMQISAPSHSESAANIGKLVAGGAVGSFATAPTTTVKVIQNVGKLCTKNGYAAAVCAGILVLAGITQQGYVAKNRAITAGYCGGVSTDNARDGCSVVRTTNYDSGDIQQSCAVIESIS